MKRLSALLGMASVFAAGVILAGCASVPKLTGTEKIAVINYTIEKSIVRQGAPKDNGPGLLNDKSVDYYQYHKAAVAQGWTVFKETAPTIFGASRLVEMSTVVGNPEITALTAPVSKIVMGTETSPASMYVYPEGLNYLNIFDSQLVSKIAGITKADLLLSVSIKAEYAMSSGIGLGALAVGNARMILNTTINVATAQGKLMRTVQLKGFSSEDASITGNTMSKSDFPRLIASAQKDLSEKMAKEFAAW